MTRIQLAYFWATAGISCIIVGLFKQSWQYCLTGAVCCFMAIALNVKNK